MAQTNKKKEYRLFFKTEKFKYYATENGNVLRINENHKVLEMKRHFSLSVIDTKFYFINILSQKVSLSKIMFDAFFKYKLGGEYKDYWCVHKNNDTSDFSVANLDFIRKKKPKNLSNPNSRKVIFINIEKNQGIVYSSIKKCADKLGYSSIFVSRIINTTQKFCSLKYKNKIMFYDDYLKLKEERGKTKCAS